MHWYMQMLLLTDNTSDRQYLLLSLYHEHGLTKVEAQEGEMHLR